MHTYTYNAKMCVRARQNACARGDLILPRFNLGPRDRRPVRQLPYLPTNRIIATDSAVVSPPRLVVEQLLIESTVQLAIGDRRASILAVHSTQLALCSLSSGVCVSVFCRRKFAGNFAAYLSSTETTGLFCI